MEAHVKIGGHDVISSGTILCPADDVITVRPTNENSPYFVEFRFLNDPSLSGGIVQNFVHGPGQIVESKNFDQIGGFATTLTAPLYVGNLNSRKMMLWFSSILIGSGPTIRNFTFTFFYGDPING